MSSFFSNYRIIFILHFLHVIIFVVLHCDTNEKSTAWTNFYLIWLAVLFIYKEKEKGERVCVITG